LSGRLSVLDGANDNATSAVQRRITNYFVGSVEPNATGINWGWVGRQTLNVEVFYVGTSREGNAVKYWKIGHVSLHKMNKF
jgi:hypothetical protein